MVVVDICLFEEEDVNLFEFEGIEVVYLFFFCLVIKFGDLLKDKEYYLYCVKGVMS